MTDEEAVMTMGVILTAAREETGHTRQYVADAMGLNYRTIGGLERGEGKSLKGPTPATTRAVEDFYGWRKGSLREFWEHRRELKFGTITVENFLPDPEPEPTGLKSASQLTDDELMSELSFRFLMRDRRLHGSHDD